MCGWDGEGHGHRSPCTTSSGANADLESTQQPCAHLDTAAPSACTRALLQLAHLRWRIAYGANHAGLPVNISLRLSRPLARASHNPLADDRFYGVCNQWAVAKHSSGRFRSTSCVRGCPPAAQAVSQACEHNQTCLYVPACFSHILKALQVDMASQGATGFVDHEQRKHQQGTSLIRKDLADLNALAAEISAAGVTK